MMDIERVFRERMFEGIRLVPDGKEQFVVCTHSEFDNGDGIEVILKRDNGDWYLTDLAHTFMHLDNSCTDYLGLGTRRELVERILIQRGVENRNGELRMRLDMDDIPYSVAMFFQGIAQIAVIAMLKPQVVEAIARDDALLRAAEIPATATENAPLR